MSIEHFWYPRSVGLTASDTVLASARTEASVTYLGKRPGESAWHQLPGLTTLVSRCTVEAPCLAGLRCIILSNIQASNAAETLASKGATLEPAKMVAMYNVFGKQVGSHYVRARSKPVPTEPPI